MFEDSIRANIRLGQPSVSDEDIEKALHQANAYDFVKKMPDGLDTFVGEGIGWNF